MGGKDERRPLHHVGCYNQSLVLAPPGSDRHGSDSVLKVRKPQPKLEVHAADPSSGSEIRRSAFNSLHGHIIPQGTVRVA